MKHVQRVSAARAYALGAGRVAVNGARAGEPSPEFADAKTDFLNAVWLAWQNFMFAKKNELLV